VFAGNRQTEKSFLNGLMIPVLILRPSRREKALVIEVAGAVEKVLKFGAASPERFGTTSVNYQG